MSEITSRLSTALADRYKIERHLGEGGMATVYLAEDLKHKRQVAVKVLRPELASVLGAEKLLLLTNTQGVLDTEGKLLTGITARETDRLIKQGIIHGGMLPKVTCALDAVKSGVKTSQIIDGRVRHSVLLELLTDTGVGTLIKA